MAIVRVRGCRIDTAQRAVTDADGAPVDLRPQALELLCVLAERAGEVVTKQELFERVWPAMVVTDDSLVQAVSDARRALGDEVRSAIQTVPRRGYRLVSDARFEEQPAVEAPPGAAPRPWWRRARTVVSAVVGVSIAAAMAWRWVAAGDAAPERSLKPALAVLPYRVEGGPADDGAAGRGVAADLIAELARDAAMPVVSGQSSFMRELEGLPAPAVASRLKVRYVVEGTVRQDGERLRVRTQLVDGRDGRIVWVDEAEPDVHRLRSARRELMRRIATTLDATIQSADKRQALARAPASMDAYWLTMRALAHKHEFTPQGHAAARAEAQQAIELDPSYALAWAVLAIVESTDAQFRLTGRWDDPGPRLQAALLKADRAVQLDASLPMGHSARADALAGLGDTPRAADAAAAAASLAPGDADVLSVLAGVQLLNGQVDAAVANMNRARAAFPIAPVHVSFMSALVAWGAKDLETARREGDDCLTRAPRHTGCLVLQSTVLFELGRIDEAHSVADRFKAVAPGAKVRHTLEAFGRAESLKERRRRAMLALGFEA